MVVFHQYIISFDFVSTVFTNKLSERGNASRRFVSPGYVCFTCRPIYSSTEQVWAWMRTFVGNLQYNNVPEMGNLLMQTKNWVKIKSCKLYQKRALLAHNCRFTNEHLWSLNRVLPSLRPLCWSYILENTDGGHLIKS